MIGKIVKGKSFKECISYILEKEKAELLDSEGVLVTDKKSIINSFYMQSLLNPKLSKCVGHIPLAFSTEDIPILDNDFMIQLAKEYIKLMGIKNTQYIIVRHNNTSHPHCHIVFNRVDNDGRTISDKNDHYRNEKVCKQLKDKYNLTYGKGKENVNVHKLKGAEKTKYEIYHAIKSSLPKSKNRNQLELLLNLKGISIEYKHKGQTNEIQGVSFKKGKYSFKGSDIDRKFSYSKLNFILNENKNHQEQYPQITISKESSTKPIENIAFTIIDTVSGLGGLLDLNPSCYDSNEADYNHQQAEERKKKKKKQRGMRK